MSKIYHIKLPISDQEVEQLQTGDTVYLTGQVCTARDMAHLRIKELLEKGSPLPVDFKGNAVFHAGPVVKKNDDKWELSVIGPTTSIRMEPHAEMMGQLGVKMIIGKGGMSSGSLAAFMKYKQVYLQAPPGCAVKLGSAVKSVIDVHWLELGMPEAMWVLDVEEFGPFIVTMDTAGGNVHSMLREKAYEQIESLVPSK
ncbi:MAG: FumA C-terminus/TtdB family hydratase beta subunit [Syntrophomonadaceae bacterium]|jgi:tartrate/fumarate subfamily iron-sulfur-dependent hydro-lyase beta chain